jgi:hypothetical protein
MNAVAVAWPIPLVAPVTNTCVPLKSNIVELVGRMPFATCSPRSSFI